MSTTIITLAPAVIADCNRLHQQAQSKAAQAKQIAEEATHCAILLGIRLEEIKKQCPHGQWEGLFAGAEERITGSNANQTEERFAFEFSSRTAAKYMEAARNVIANPALKSAHRKAILAIAAAPGAELGEAEREHLSAATNGKTLRQLYLDFGIIKPTTEDTILKGGAQPGAGRPKKDQFLPENEDAEFATATWVAAWTSDVVRPGFLDALTKDQLGILADHIKGFLDTVQALRKAR